MVDEGSRGEVVIPPEVVGKIRDMRRGKYEAEADLASLKSQVKAKQAELEELNDQLWRLNAELTDPLPLFAGIGDAGAGPPPSEGAPLPAEAAPFPAEAARLPTFEGHADWRTVPVGDLTRFGLTAKLVEKMVEGGLGTIGDVAELNAKGLSLVDVKGVGEKAADRIESALALFWKAWGPADARGGEGEVDAKAAASEGDAPAPPAEAPPPPAEAPPPPAEAPAPPDEAPAHPDATPPSPPPPSEAA